MFLFICFCFMYIRMSLHACFHVLLCECRFLSVWVYICLHVCMNVDMNVYTCVHTHIFG